MFSPAIILQAALLAVGVYWIVQMLGRWRDHADILRTGEDRMTQAVVIGMWAVTAVVAFLVVTFVVSLGARIVGGVRDLM